MPSLMTRICLPWMTLHLCLVQLQASLWRMLTGAALIFERWHHSVHVVVRLSRAMHFVAKVKGIQTLF